MKNGFVEALLLSGLALILLFIFGLYTADRFDKQDKRLASIEMSLSHDHSKDIHLAPTSPNSLLDVSSGVHQTNYLSTNNFDPNVRWLQSVVTEAYQKESETSWISVSPGIFGQIADVTTIIGLKKDGTVVWKKRE